MSNQSQPEKGLEQYIAVEVTHKQGQQLPEPVTEHYYPNQYEQVSKLAGFKGTITHDPRKASEKKTTEPAIDVVKTTEPLSSVEQLRARYQELFKEEAPFNADEDGLRRLVEGAEAKLAEPEQGEATVALEADTTAAPVAPVSKKK